MKKLLAPLVCVSLLSGCVVHVGDFDDRPTEHFSKQLTLPVGSIDQINIDSGAGEVRVKGVAGLDRIEVDANIWAHSDEGDDYIFTLDTSGRSAELVGKQRNRKGFNFRFGGSTRVDMTVRVPQHLMVDIDDGSGDIVLSNINGEVKIDDGSGDIEITKLGGDLIVEDNSGSIYIKDVAGQVEIDDNSGELQVHQVDGRVDIEDGSGDIEVSDVRSTVRIDDGSGDINVSRVSRLRIVESGSGDVSVHDVDSYSK